MKNSRIRLGAVLLSSNWHVIIESETLINPGNNLKE